MKHQKSYFWFPRLSGVTLAMNLSWSAQDFLNLSFHMFPYNLVFGTSTQKIPQNMKFQPNQLRVLELRAFEN